MRQSFAWVSDFKISDMFGFKLHPPTMVSFQRNVSIFMLDHIGQSCLAGPLSVLVYLRRGCTLPGLCAYCANRGGSDRWVRGRPQPHSDLTHK